MCLHFYSDSNIECVVVDLRVSCGSVLGSGEIKSSVFNRLGQEVTNSIKTPPTRASSKTTFRVTMQGLDREDVIPTQAKVST